MSSGRRIKRKPMAQINVVPYIDVMLVLLVIFMVTAPMLQQGVEVDLPNAVTEPVSSADDNDANKIVIAVTADGEFFIDEEGKDAYPLDAATLANRVSDMLAERKDKRVYVRGDEQVDYGKVMTAMAALQAAGASSIGLITEPGDQ